MTSERTQLKRDLRKAGGRRRLTAILLVLPLFLFLLFSFIIPIADMLRRSVVDNELATAWPNTTAMLQAWDHSSPPDEAMFRALGTDLRASAEVRTIATPARRLNYALENGRSLVMNTGRSLRALEGEPQSWRDTLLKEDPSWGDKKTWIALAQASGPLTDFYLLTALDLERDPEGTIVSRPPQQSLYLDVLLRTGTMSLSVTLLCLVLGFPLAYYVANAPEKTGNLLMILVLLPLWTSLLVRSAAWIVLLQDQGLVNAMLMAVGFSDRPVPLIYNRIGVLIAMVHVQLPFMVLPIIATMKAIPTAYMRAAISLGAHPAIAFVRVYLPQTFPGVAAGTLLVFIMSLGYYVTPALVGGANDQMLAYFIAYYTTSSANWGLAAALGVLLLGATAVLYFVYARLTNLGQVKLG
ncbi:putative spermidine/putrescine transport system permease protein [Rhodoligotrophos appendicifer]|uniref:ABC transporter permease n=1 Tax=Rhodoligotrophos appendicifer TaxID=987056 RepID=UPI0011855928|nr:ABC transporter permease [Rhodoligotrophos appendicifer]